MEESATFDYENLRIFLMILINLRRFSVWFRDVTDERYRHLERESAGRM